MDKHPADVLVESFVHGQLDNARATELRGHLIECSFCRTRIGESEWEDVVEVEKTLVAQTPILPPAQDFENREVPPSLGDVWRLVWNDANELGVIDDLDSESQRVVVLPVLPNVDDADEWCGLTALNVIGREFDIAVSVALSTSIPWFVLDSRVGHVEQFEDLRQLRSEFKQTDQLQSQIVRGLPIQVEFDQRIEAIGELGETFHDLAEAQWGVDIPEDAADQNLPPFETLVELEFPISRALSLVRGQTAPSPEELAVIGMQSDVSNWTGISIPDALRRELNLPRWRPALRLRAEENNTLESEERVSVALEARQPVAARGTRGEPVEWRLLLEHLLK